MNSDFPRVFLRSPLTSSISLLIAIILFVAPVFAQRRPAAPAKAPAARDAPPRPEPTFDNLLGADRYKLYGEVRNIGQLLSTGGAGDIVEPIIKLAEPPKEFKSIIKFLRTNAEPLLTTRLLFATWPARGDLPNAFVAIEFANAEDAAKFAPRLETFLPTVLPPVPVVPEEKPGDRSQPKTDQQNSKEIKPQNATTQNSPAPKPEERLPFVISHSGNLVFISDKSFKFEKLHPANSKALAEDQNFRIARDRFSAEPVFLFFNVALEEQNKPKPKQLTVSETDQERIRKEEEARAEARAEAEAEMARNAPTEPPPPERQPQPTLRGTSTLVVGEVPPPPPPTDAQKAQMAMGSQIGRMFDAIGFGEPQWPEALGVAIALDNNEYVVKAILVEPPEAKKLLLPFVPQLVSGPAYASDASSVLPEDTEIFVSASIDFLQTYEEMRKQAEIKAKDQLRQIPAAAKEPPLDPWAEFEKKAHFKIKDELLPALGNEIALAGSLKTLQGVGGPFAIPAGSSKPKAPAEEGKEDQKPGEVFPVLLIAVKDREAARRLMPRILDGLGIGEANLIAQVEKREDAELVNYGGLFAYAFVDNFLVISEAASVRRVIDAALNHRTLSSNSAFRNSRHWEPSRTLGQIYISPALMEGYHDEIRKQSATMDPEMRDFLLGLDPAAGAISYALSNEGLGAQHELHLPKNLILTMVAGISSVTKSPPPEMNEQIAIGMLQAIASAEAAYKGTAGDGTYGTMDNLVQQKLLEKDMFEKYGYQYSLTLTGDGFEAVATPREYVKTGKRSFFIDKSGVVRGDDHGGGPATIADKPVQP